MDKDAVEKRKGDDNVSVTQTVSSHLLSKSTHVPKDMHKGSISHPIYVKQN